MITLELFKKEIEEKWYTVVQRNGQTPWLQCYIPYDGDKHNKFITFAIEVRGEDQIIFRDGNEQIPNIKTFSNQKKLYEHLEELFSD
jgi:hypothetical protein